VDIRQYHVLGTAVVSARRVRFPHAWIMVSAVRTLVSTDDADLARLTSADQQARLSRRLPLRWDG
jgi:hypothetical protein